VAPIQVTRDRLVGHPGGEQVQQAAVVTGFAVGRAGCTGCSRLAERHRRGALPERVEDVQQRVEQRARAYHHEPRDVGLGDRDRDAGELTVEGGQLERHPWEEARLLAGRDIAGDGVDGSGGGVQRRLVVDAAVDDAASERLELDLVRRAARSRVGRGVQRLNQVPGASLQLLEPLVHGLGAGDDLDHAGRLCLQALVEVGHQPLRGRPRLIKVGEPA